MTEGSPNLVEFTQPTIDALAAINSAPKPVQLSRTKIKASPDVLLWYVIKKSTDMLSFKNYKAFTDIVLCRNKEAFDELDAIEKERIIDPDDGKTIRYNHLKNRRFLPFNDTDAYRLLKVATEAFLIVNCAIPLDIEAEGMITTTEVEDLLRNLDAEPDSALLQKWLSDYLKSINGTGSVTLPYLYLVWKKLEDAPIKERIFYLDDAPIDPAQLTEIGKKCYGILSRKLTNPCLLELIWSYWHEQGLLVQTMNAISRRFQNVRGYNDNDPLAMLEFDPLRPLNNLLWGYLQDEQHRLSIVRRAYEYDHHYGLTLEGKAIPPMRPADSRSKFLESFHNLLSISSAYFKQSDDTTVIADGFPVLNALRDLHMILAEGAHNQFNDLPSAARQEMLMQQWLLARTEFREVLPSRTMVAYPEPWMDRVDSMKRLQNWNDTSVMHFHNLGVYGEQILLSVRYGSWNEVDEPSQAGLWARFWRAQIQGYLYAYRAVTGVDLSVDAATPEQRKIRVAQPAVLLRQRSNSSSLASSPSPTNSSAGFRDRRANRNQP